MREIAHTFRIPLTTVRRTIKQFLDTNEVKPPQRGARKDLMSHQLKEKLLDPKTLQEWAPYSLRDRVVLCNKRFNQNISYSALYKLYVRNNVNFKRTLWQYRTATKNEVNFNEYRYQFAQLLASVILHDKPLIYIDESR